MNFRTYHCNAQNVVSFKDLLPKISKTLGENFTPLFHEALRKTNKQLANVGLEISIPIFEEDLEVFINKETKHALALRLIPGSPNKPFLDMLEFSAGNKMEHIRESLQKAIGVNIKEGSFLETALLNRVQKRLGKLSPNGKKLADNKLRQKIRILYNDSVRSKVTKILSTYSDNVVSLEAIKDLLKENNSSIKKLCNDSGLFAKRYVILCNECATPHLAFSTKKKAADAMADSNNYCALCEKKGTLDIVEGYEVLEVLRLGIQQGLWLESLASDVISEFTQHIWSGQMVDTNELDVLSVYCDKIILIECKDTSFGQNDFYVTAMKAQDIQADIVIIVLTHDINPNVQSNIDRYKHEGERTFRTIIDTSVEKIRSSLKTTLEKIQNDYITKWFSAGVDRYFLRSRFPRRFISQYR